MTLPVMEAVFLLMIISGVILIIISRKRSREIPPEEDFEETVKGCSRCDALVLDVHREGAGRAGRRVMILQIRFEEQRRTVVHKCTERFYGKYTRGQHIPVLFREDIPVDFCMLQKDNRFLRGRARDQLRGRLLAAVGMLLIIAGMAGLIVLH